MCEFCRKWVNFIYQHNKICKVRNFFNNPPVNFNQLLEKYNIIPKYRNIKHKLTNQSEKSKIINENKKLEKKLSLAKDKLSQLRSIIDADTEEIYKEMNFNTQLELYSENYFPNLYFDLSNKKFIMTRRYKKKIIKMEKSLVLIKNLEDFMSMKSNWFQLLSDNNIPVGEIGSK